MSPTIKLPFVLIFFAENRPCCENFKFRQQITCAKSFFCKVVWAMNRSCQDFWPGNINIFFFTITSIFHKVFSIVFPVFCFILFVKCSQGCVFSPEILVKKNVFYRVTKGDFLIAKGIPFCKNQFPDVNLYFQPQLAALLPI